MKYFAILALVLLTSACQRQGGDDVTKADDAGGSVQQPRTPDYDNPALPQKATPEGPAHDGAVQLTAKEGSNVTGSLALNGAPEGVHIVGAIQGLQPDSEFGFHIHEKGDCSAPDASSAGPHFNPTGQQHGDPGSQAHHAGDMVNIRSNAEGVARVDTTARGATINSGESTDVMGRAVVVHEKPDDYKTQPSGNSGKRIACGVIEKAPEPQA